MIAKAMTPKSTFTWPRLRYCRSKKSTADGLSPSACRCFQVRPFSQYNTPATASKQPAKAPPKPLQNDDIAEDLRLDLYRTQYVIRQAEQRAFDLFLTTYEAKYPKATACVAKDREELLTFYAFPAQHWQHLRTTNPIESTFGTIRHRTTRTKGCLTRDGMLHMMFKLGRCAEQTWRRLRGFRQLAQVIKGIQFIDGSEVTSQEPVAA